MSKEKPYPPISFREFTVPTYEGWKEAAIKALKGEDFDKKLLSKTFEGITLKPIYTRAEFESGTEHDTNLPGFAPYKRGSSPSGYLNTFWHCASEISENGAKEIHTLVKEELASGANAISLSLSPAAKGLSCDNSGCAGADIFGKNTLREALGGIINLEKYGLYLNTGPSSYPFVYLLDCGKSCFKKAAGGHIGGAPLSTFAEQGTLPRSVSVIYDEMADAVKFMKENSPNIRTVVANGEVYANGGADSVTEIACLMGEVSEYMFELTSRGISVDDAASSIGITVSLSGNFFMEIAKVRAARVLFAQITKDFGAGEKSQAASIRGVTSRFNKSKLDPYTNVLRLSTEAFSGVIGGLDALTVLPFDSTVGGSNKQSRRISRNIAIMMAEEFSLSAPLDPVGGSYYVETLTEEFAEKAWGKFMEYEEAGGFYQALLKGIPQKTIAAGLADKKFRMATRQLKAVGVNMYANAKEAAPQSSENNKQQATSEINSDKIDEGIDVAPAALRTAFDNGLSTLSIFNKLAAGSESPVCEPIPSVRLGENFEALREKTVELGGISVLLLNMGPVKEHKARSDFSAGFFETGGFTVFGDKVFDTAEAAVEGVTADFDICVICSTDDNYPVLVPAITKGIREKSPNTQVILAGIPAADFKDVYFEAGLTDFIHLRSNCLETLQKAQSRVNRKGGQTNA